ncbi:MAG: hypothetical protein AAF633_03140 [Chloroflexota bacterium]
MPIVTGIIGFMIGLFLFGWLLTPVTYTQATPQDLRSEDFQQFYLRGVAALHANGQLDDNVARAALNAGGAWGTDGAALAVCNAERIAREGSGEDVNYAPIDANAAANLNQLAQVLRNENCDQVRAAEAAGAISEPGGSNLTQTLVTCLLGLVLLGLAFTALWLWQRRNTEDNFAADFDIPTTRSSGMPTNPPSVTTESSDAESSSEESGSVVPIASYRTTYELGLDAYDDSFSIENVNGEFLGECGVGISESLGSETPKRVTALEVWLFDKNDIRTITKVVMSDHAFFDEAIKAKLAPKGEPILARPDEVIVLETATLIINARITELIYGDERQSFFERFAVELSAWAKEDSPASSIEYDYD